QATAGSVAGCGSSCDGGPHVSGRQRLTSPRPGCARTSTRGAVIIASRVPGSIVQTKLYVPRRRAATVPRPRLSDRLRRGIEARLTLVSAPAGFGKTTLLAAALQGTADGKRVIAWLSLDPSDNDPTAFWTYVIAALQTVAPDV